MTSTLNTTAGKIMLVGIGPGSADHMTARARAAISEADTVIGYVTYIKLVADLIEGKEIIRKSMTEELDRAIEALARAREGAQYAGEPDPYRKPAEDEEDRCTQVGGNSCVERQFGRTGDVREVTSDDDDRVARVFHGVEAFDNRREGGFLVGVHVVV